MWWLAANEFCAMTLSNALVRFLLNRTSLPSRAIMNHFARLATSRCSVVCMVAFVRALMCGAQCVADDIGQAKFAVEGFLANYAAFEFYVCDMTIRSGKSDSVETAISSGPETDIAAGKARLVVDGRLLCYERSTDSSMIWDPTTNRGSMQLTPKALIRNADYIMRGNPVMGSMSIQPSSEGTGSARWSGGVDMTTWNGGGWLKSGEAGNFGQFVAPQFIPAVEFAVRNGVEILGVKTQQIDLRWKGGALSFFVDKHRGFIPIETRMYSDADGKTPGTRLFVTDIRECSGRRWFPMRCVAISMDGHEVSGQHLVREIVVTRLDVDKRPSRDAFSLKLPAGYSINDPDRSPSQYKLEEDETVTLANLPAFYERTFHEHQVADLQPPARSPLRTALLIANVVFLILLGGFVAFRILRRRAAHE